MTPRKPGIATIATSADRAAVGVILIEAADPTSLLAKHFLDSKGRQLDRPTANQIYFGTWNSGKDGETEEQPAPGEEVVVALVGDQVELHCHGGRVAARRIMADLIADGFEHRDWLSRPAEVEPRIRSSCEAERALAHALTARCALVLVDQLNGALGRACAEIRRQIDSDQPSQAIRRLRRLLQTTACGRHLTQEWRVALIGRPNVGKSSLMNQFSGFDRSIVFDEPGTTRDLVTITTAINGWPFEFIDTAGIRETESLIESTGVQRSSAVADDADCVLLVSDSSAPWGASDAELHQRWPDAMVVHNKSDLESISSNEQLRPSGLSVSAATGAGLEDLMVAIVSRVIPTAPEEGEAVLFTERQASCVSTAISALESGQQDDAIQSLRRLLSEPGDHSNV